MTPDEWLIETYFEWLVADAFESRTDLGTYSGVLKALHDIPFYWTLWSDENRAGDALAFRQFDFLEELTDPRNSLVDQHWLENWATATPSVLEVLMGIARRWNMYFDGRVSYYFEHLWKNMGFDRYPGSQLNGSGLDMIRLKVDNWMSRQFQPNGIGSPFPVNDQIVFDIMDMRQVDIWGQMNAYSAEHFQ